MSDIANRIGADPDPVYRVANISSLIAVCAMALDAVGEFNDDIRKRTTMDIKHVLELSVIYADETTIDVERAISAVEKGGAK
jgi:hypothetical protein